MGKLYQNMTNQEKEEDRKRKRLSRWKRNIEKWWPDIYAEVHAENNHTVPPPDNMPTWWLEVREQVMEDIHRITDARIDERLH